MEKEFVFHHGNIYSIFFDQKENKVLLLNRILYRILNMKFCLDLNITFFQSVWLSWVILFRASAKVNNPKGFTSKFMANIWACFCLAFTASYTANLGLYYLLLNSFLQK